MAHTVRTFRRTLDDLVNSVGPEAPINIRVGDRVFPFYFGQVSQEGRTVLITAAFQEKTLEEHAAEAIALVS